MGSNPGAAPGLGWGNAHGARAIVSLDFGTTFSSVGISIRNGDNVTRSHSISNYHDDPIVNNQASFQVPTESLYCTAEQLQKIRRHQNFEEIEEDQIRTGPSPVFYIWGYETWAFNKFDSQQDRHNRISKPKLLLDDSVGTQSVRDRLRPILDRLRENKVITEDEQVISDYLTRLFRHAKQQATQHFRLEEDMPAEHVATVPVTWGPKTLRKMQNAIAIAVESSQFGSMNNFFFISEPEAAAQFIIEKTREIKVSVERADWVRY